MSQTDPKSGYGLFALAVVLLLSGIAINVVYFDDFRFRTAGLLLVIVGVLLVKASNVRGLMGLRATKDPQLTLQVRKRPGPLAWALSVASALALVIFYICMCEDQRAGGNYVWPAYAFAVSGLIAAVTWGYVAAKFF